MDTNRYADLVNMYANNVYKIAVSYCNNRSDAEDIVQNVFIKLLKSKEKFKDDEHVKRWLIRVAINESKNMNTSFWRKRIVPLEDSEPIINTRDKSDEKAVLLGAVMKLKEKNRIVVQLYYYEGYSVKEIAKILRIKETTVNKKCIESLIKAGAFDELGQTRKTLMLSYENIIDTISNDKKGFDGQVSMFDLGGETQNEEIKYNYIIESEYDEKEKLSMEKEMLGIYISGHPLEKLRTQIEAKTTINSLKLRELSEPSEIEEDEKVTEYQDGQNVIYAGIVTSVKKKYTKNNTIMAFVTIEDLYGATEFIVFDSCYRQCSDILVNDNIVEVEGRLSIREDEEPKIVARTIKEFAEIKKKAFELNVTNLNEETKEKLKGAIYFFNGERRNMQMQIRNGEKLDKAGGIYMTSEILKEFQELVGEENAQIVTI